ncbi:MAG: DUF2834 domain-containing protein [Alkalinema sp. RU_4_3]|nr:DUF2834 domain-containing protein [Alkalinema sp. RU_4_3]
MVRRLGFAGLWLLFLGYATFLAPGDGPETLDLIVRLSTGQVAGINPVIVALFNLMGVLPLAYSCLLYADGRGQKIWAWPFAAGAFAVGAFALIPYLGLRQDNPGWIGPKSRTIRFWDSRYTAIAIFMAALILVLYGVLAGDWADFGRQWQGSKFIHVMSLDFCLLSLLGSELVPDDMARRGMVDSRLLTVVQWVPLFGLLVYLVVRPRLPEVVETVAV